MMTQHVLYAMAWGGIAGVLWILTMVAVGEIAGRVGLRWGRPPE